MNENLVITDGELDFKDYCELSDDEIASIVGKNNVLVLPTKIEKGIVFEEDTIDFIKYCSELDETNQYGLLAVGDVQTRSLHSFDVIMPLIAILRENAVPIVLRTVSAFIYDKIKGKRDQTVKMSIQVKTRKKNMRFDYEGPVEGLDEAFKRIETANSDD